MTTNTAPEAPAAAEVATTTDQASSTALARYDQASKTMVIPTNIPDLVLTFHRDQEELDADQMHMLAPLGIEADWDPRQVAVFLLQCHRRRLDPWRKQAYLLIIDRKYVMHTSIGGLLSKAEETGRYRGTVGPQWCGPDGVWRDVWLDGAMPPAGARVGVMRADFDTPVWGVATYEEFAPYIDEMIWVDDPSGATHPDGRPKRKKVATGHRRPMANWRCARDGGKPGVMLKKVALAAGLRDAFPEECGGFYVSEETEKSRHEAETSFQTAAADDTATAAEDTPAARRREAFDAAMAQTAAAGEFPVFAGLGLANERARDLLLAELDEQAAVLGKTRGEMVARWSASRGGQAIEAAPLRDLAAFVRAWRPYVLRALRDQGNDAEADRYMAGPDVGTVEELFGRSATTITVDAA